MPTIINGTTGVNLVQPSITIATPTLTSPTISTPTMTGQATIPTINLTGGQIVFPATKVPSANANTLDDYEEGTWTPAFTSTGATFTYPRGQFGSYCKIGSLVYAQFYVGATAAGTTSNPLTLTGLPFTSINISILAQPSGSAWVSTATAIGMTVDTNSTSITFWVQNGGIVTATAAQMSGGYLVGNVMYRAA